MVKQNRKFKGVWIPREVWLNRDLSFIEKCLLVEIDSLDNEDGCVASNGYFAEFFGVSESSISRYVSRLFKAKLITVEILKNYKRVCHIDEGGYAILRRGVKQNCLDNNTINNTENNDFSKKEKSPSSLPGKVLPRSIKSADEIVEVRVDGEGMEVEMAKRTPKAVSAPLKKINTAFRELCQKHIGSKPQLALGKQGAIIKSALKELSEKDIYDLFEWWFLEPQKGKEDYDLMQITQALSAYNITKYKIQNGK